MDGFTFEYKDSGQRSETEKNIEIYEKYEWDNMWIEHANESERKRVAYIGDSISCGIRGLITQRTNEDILCDGFGTSKSADNPFYIKSFEFFLEQLPQVSDIIINNGLHGWHLSDEQYKKHFDESIEFLIKKYNRSRVFIVLTTALLDNEKNKRVIARNKIAQTIAQKHSLAIIDLYKITEENKDKYLDDGVHLNKKLYEKLADEIILHIK